LSTAGVLICVDENENAADHNRVEPGIVQDMGEILVVGPFYVRRAEQDMREICW
jgi:hypothetical protein